MSKVEDYIYQFEGHQREVMLYFHDMLVTELNLLDKIRFKIPFYYGRSWICYLNPRNNNSVEFAFVRGNELSNNQGILESKGRKQVLSIEIKTLVGLPIQEIADMIQEAILLDETTPYASKRKP